MTPEKPEGETRMPNQETRDAYEEAANDPDFRAEMRSLDPPKPKCAKCKDTHYVITRQWNRDAGAWLVRADLCDECMPATTGGKWGQENNPCRDSSEKGSKPVGSKDRSEKGTGILTSGEWQCRINQHLAGEPGWASAEQELFDHDRALRARVEELENHNDGLLGALETERDIHAEQIGELQAELARYRDAVKMLTTERWEGLADFVLNQACGKPLVGEQMKIDALRRIAKLAEEELDTTQQWNDLFTSRIRRYVKEIRALRTRVKVLEAQAANMADDILDIQGQAIRYSEELDRVQAELARYRDAVKALTSDQWEDMAEWGHLLADQCEHERFPKRYVAALRRIAKLAEEEPTP